MSNYTLDDHCKTVKANVTEDENQKKLDQITDNIKAFEGYIRSFETLLDGTKAAYKVYIDSKKDEFDELMGAMYKSKES